MSELAVPRGLDPGIESIVLKLREHGVETYESCGGGEGHAYREPTVRFSGTKAAGWFALGVCHDHRLPVRELRWRWMIEDWEPHGPYWEMTFRLEPRFPVQLMAPTSGDPDDSPSGSHAEHVTKLMTHGT